MLCIYVLSNLLFYKYFWAWNLKFLYKFPNIGQVSMLKTAKNKFSVKKSVKNNKCY